MFGGSACKCGVPKGVECTRCNGAGRIEMLEHCPRCGGNGREPEQKYGIIIPHAAPQSVIDALRNFVAAIEGYDETGVWPDNRTLLALARDGRAALQSDHSSNT